MVFNDWLCGGFGSIFGSKTFYIFRVWVRDRDIPFNSGKKQIDKDREVGEKACASAKCKPKFSDGWRCRGMNVFGAINDVEKNRCWNINNKETDKCLMNYLFDAMQQNK